MANELKTDRALDKNLRPLKVGDEATAPIELATDKIRVRENATFSKDLTIEGDLKIEGSTGDIAMTNGTKIQSSDIAGFISVEALGLAIYGSTYEGDNDTTDNDAQLTLVPATGMDAKVNFYDASSIKWTIGNDASASDELKFDADNVTVGANTKMTLTDGGNLSTAGTILSGWHGSTTRIKFFPHQFVEHEAANARNFALVEDDVAGKLGVRVSNTSAILFTWVEIPTGYTATVARCYADTGSNLDVQFYSTDIDDGDITDIGSGDASAEVNITDVASTSTNSIIVMLTFANTTTEFYGGYITITES